MKRTKKMFLAAMVAAIAVTVMMIAPAFAASANCPLKNLLTSTASGSPLSGSDNATPSSGTDLSGLLQQYLGNGSSTCPKTALLQQLLGGNVAGANSAACPNGDCTTGNCTTGACADNNCTSGNCATVCPSGTCSTGSCPMSGALSGLLGQ